MRARILALTLAFSFWVSIVPAAPASPPVGQYARTQWTERDGLGSSLIWAITQDHEGYLWLGTDAGVIRFDGVRFVHIDEPQLKTARIGAVFGTRDGSVWIGSNSSAVLTRYYGGQFTYYSSSDGLPLGVTALLEDREGTLWVGGRGGLSRRTPTQRWQPAGLEVGLTTDAVTGLLEDDQKALWVATLRGLYRKPFGSDTFTAMQSPFHVRRLVDDRAGRLWATSPEQAIGTLHDKRTTALLSEWKDVNGWTLLRDRKNNIWVGTLGRGLIRISGVDTDQPVVERLGRDRGLTHDVVRAIFEDREGNIWVGTQRGLDRLLESNIRMLTSESDVMQPVRAVTASADGSVWAGTDNGVYRFFNNQITHYDRSDGLGALSIGALYTDSAGTLWVAADHGGISKFEGGRFVPAMASTAELKRVWAMTTDREGAFWLCEVDSGLHQWKDGVTRSFEREVGRRFCGAVLTDRNDRVWLGFSDGTVVVHEGTHFTTYGKRDGLAGGSVGTIHEDSSGTIWIGSANGLTSFSGGRFKQWNDATGESRANVRAIVEDGQHTLWLGDSTGLIRMDDPSGNGPAFNLFDGLRGIPMSVGGFPTSARSSDGRLWFVTSGGLAALDPATVFQPHLAPPVKIEAIVADDRPWNLNQTVALPPRTSRIQFDYTALSLTAPEKVRFRYLLEGFDKDWIEVGSRRQAFYTNLPPRDYRFRVIADLDGTWNDQGKFVDFTIRPTFFQTWAFDAVLAGTGFLLILGAWRIRTAQVHRKYALIVGERTRVAREIHDTLLQSLVGVAFQFDAASNELDDSPQVAKTRLSKLRTQIEQAIKEARTSIWDLRSPTLERRELATALREAGESITGRSVKFSLAVAGAPPQRQPRLDEALLRIGREAISNAVRHARATEVSVELSYDDREVTLRVIDNGRGFESAGTELADHWGLATMRERAEQLGGRLRLNSSPGRGTQVEFMAPFAQRPGTS